MRIDWTNTITTYFDLDQAQEDFESIMEWNPQKDPDRAIYDAVHANFNVDGEEYLDIQPGIEIAAQALRERVGGVQLTMKLE